MNINIKIKHTDNDAPTLLASPDGSCELSINTNKTIYKQLIKHCIYVIIRLNVFKYNDVMFGTFEEDKIKMCTSDNLSCVTFYFSYTEDINMDDHIINIEQI